MRTAYEGGEKKEKALAFTLISPRKRSRKEKKKKSLTRKERPPNGKV